MGICILLIILLTSFFTARPSQLSEHVQFSSWLLKTPPWTLNQHYLPSPNPGVQWTISPSSPADMEPLWDSQAEPQLAFPVMAVWKHGDVKAWRSESMVVWKHGGVRCSSWAPAVPTPTHLPAPCRKNLHLVLALQATDGSVSAVEAVLQVDPGLTNEVICPNHVMVIDKDGEQRLLWECSLDLKWPVVQVKALGVNSI